MPAEHGLGPGVLRLLIYGKGYTVEEAARRAGLDDKHMSRLISRDAGMSGQTAEKLAEMLGVHPEVLVLAHYMERADILAERAERGQET
jgi:plasmid maintenance system antidote protein VapI